MAYWHELEDWIESFGGQLEEFTHADLVSELGLSATEASTMIQAYLRTQVRDYSPTRYVLHRTGRTTASVWHVGTRARDAREVRGQFGDDVERRVMEVILPTLDRMATLNPKVRKQVMKATVDIGRAVELLIAAASPPP